MDAEDVEDYAVSFEQGGVLNDSNSGATRDQMDDAMAARTTQLLFYKRVMPLRDREKALLEWIVKSGFCPFCPFMKRGSLLKTQIRPTGLYSATDTKAVRRHLSGKHPTVLVAIRMGYRLHSSAFQSPMIPRAVKAPLMREEPALMQH